MRRSIVFALMVALLASCSTKEIDFQTPAQDDVVFYASFEQPAEVDTRIYANEDLLLRWTADDRVSIFNKITYNQQYKFTGETGDNAGGFRKVDSDEFVTGNTIPHVVSVYPYQETTKITESEVLTVTLPAEQSYAENTFGLGANSMVSVSADNVLQYKNVGGYLMLKLYGEGVSVSSITLKGNNGEILAGKASISMPLDGVPSVAMAEEATTEIILACPEPIALGATAEESTQFWFVVPPVTFSKGFTITVNQSTGGVFEKSTSKNISVERNKLSKMSVIEVDSFKSRITYTSKNGSIVTPYNTNAFGVSIISNDYVDGLGVITFDGMVTSIGERAFFECSNLSSITIPEGVTSIGDHAFHQCSSLSSISIPEGVTSIGSRAFQSCRISNIEIPRSVKSIGDYSFMDSSLSGITIPEGITRIEDGTFYSCRMLSSVSLPDGITYIGKEAFYDCKYLTNITIPSTVSTIEDYSFYACVSLSSVTILPGVTSIGDYSFMNCIELQSITIPEGVTTIGNGAFVSCSGLSSITFPNSVNNIGAQAFYLCSSLSSITIPSSVLSIGEEAFFFTSPQTITIMAMTPPSGSHYMLPFTIPIYVPFASVELYKTAQYWSDYADCIQAIPSSVPVPEAVDLGLSVKWASFNLGASKPEEYGDYYAWGETEPYYSSIDPLTWKDGKDAGYNWSSYKWCEFMGSEAKMTKYCSESSFGSYGYNGFTDTKTVLDLEDDAAYMTLGGNWCMPTEEEWAELQDNCSWEWTSMNGVDGRKVTGLNGNSIFLPAAGYRSGTNIFGAGDSGGYWSSSLFTYRSDRGYYVSFYSNDVYRIYNARYYGYSIRPVCN